jgi:hypothetical protein
MELQELLFVRQNHAYLPYPEPAKLSSFLPQPLPLMSILTLLF